MNTVEINTPSPEQFKVKVASFEGPFDLLLNLIEEKQVNIYDISISEITAAYLNYLSQMRELDLNIAGEFLVMAAFLIELKSRMLLPSGNDADSESIVEAEAERRALLEKLIEYKKFKILTQKLLQNERESAYILTREHINQKMLQQFAVKKNILVKNASMDKLNFAFKKVWQDFELRILTREIDHVSPQLFSVKDKIVDIVKRFEQFGQRVMFTELFLRVSSRFEIIATFLAILELIKQQLVLAVQDDLFEDIELIARTDLQKLDISAIVNGAESYDQVMEEAASEEQAAESARTEEEGQHEVSGNSSENSPGSTEPAPLES